MMTMNTTTHVHENHDSKTKRGRRTGATVAYTPADCPASVAILHGLTEEQATRMVRVRRTLPYVEDSTVPMIDARKLWERIGKPQGAFRKWAERDIKPLVERTGNNGQICPIFTPTKRRPRTDYLLSRNVAAHLAMLSHTPEGDDIRAYFLDMETLARKLAVHSTLRVTVVVDSDNTLTHATMVWAGNLAKDGKISSGEVKAWASAREQRIKSMVADVLSGHRAGHWRGVLGAGVGIRDVLTTDDLNWYSSAYTVAVSLVAAGMEDDAIRGALGPRFAGKIDASQYGITDEAVKAAEAETQAVIDRMRNGSPAGADASTDEFEQGDY